MTRIVNDVDDFVDLQLAIICKDKDTESATKEIMRIYDSITSNPKASKNAVMFANALLRRMNRKF